MISVVLNLLTTFKEWSNLLLVLVGLSAFGVYYWQKRDERRAAATLVKGQIDLIEERVCALKNDNQLGNVSVYHSKIIIQENLWEKYKHLLIKHLPKSDAAIIQKFFDSAERIEYVRSDIIRTMTNSWEHRSLAEHQIIGNIVQSTIHQSLPTLPKSGDEIKIQVETNEVDFFRQLYRSLELGYTPDIAINALVKYLSDFEMLSGTTAYNKIRSWSYDNR
jgi:hypothetical protein